jgi:nucleotide-binding universal stress UspA family protein
VNFASPESSPAAPIVCGLDESPTAGDVTGVAAELASRLGTDLHLLNVVAKPVVSHRPAATYPERKQEAEEMARAGQMHVLMGSAAMADGMAVTRQIGFGDPSEVLADVAGELSAPFLVVGRDSTGTFDRLVLGSTTLALFKESPCPVVVVPPGSASFPEGEAIVCGVDGSNSGLGAARAAAELGRALSLRLVLIDALDDPSDADHGLAQAAEAAEELLPKDSIEAVYLPGDPHEVLVERARRLDAALLAVGTRGRGIVRSMVLGSVSDAVVKAADRPVMVVPARGEAA